MRKRKCKTYQDQVCRKTRKAWRERVRKEKKWEVGWRGEKCAGRLEGWKGVTSGGNSMDRTGWRHRRLILPAAAAGGLQIWWFADRSPLVDTGLFESRDCVFPSGYPEGLAEDLSPANLTQPPTHSTSIQHPCVLLSI